MISSYKHNFLSFEDLNYKPNKVWYINNKISKWLHDVSTIVEILLWQQWQTIIIGEILSLSRTTLKCNWV